MQVEFTGRQSIVTAKLKEQATAALEHIETIVGKKVAAHVVLTEEKFRKTAEVAVTCKTCNDLSAKCTSAKDMESALHDALVKVEKQALKIVKRLVTLRRHPEKTAQGSVRLQTSDDHLHAQPGMMAKKKLNGKTTAPSKKQVQRAEGVPHLIKVANGGTMVMHLDQAVKAAAQSERDVFIFRNPEGAANVLYRRRDGQVEWFEVS